MIEGSVLRKTASATVVVIVDELSSRGSDSVASPTVTLIADVDSPEIKWTFDEFERNLRFWSEETTEFASRR
jgi:hypothetical protein